MQLFLHLLVRCVNIYGIVISKYWFSPRGGIMAVQRLKSFLDNHDVRYETITHPVAFSSLHLCEVCHMPSKDVAKTVICKTVNKMFMVVVRAHDQIDLDMLSKELGEPVVLATEREFSTNFPDCEVGAMPPFGNLYDMDVYCSDTLAEDEKIAFNAGNHSECYKVLWADYENLVHPRIIHITH